MSESSTVETSERRAKSIIYNIRRTLYDTGGDWKEVGEKENELGITRTTCEAPISIFINFGIGASILQGLDLTYLVNSLLSTYPAIDLDTARSLILSENAGEATLRIYDYASFLKADSITKAKAGLPTNFFDQFKYLLGDSMYGAHNVVNGVFLALNNIIFHGGPVIAASTNLAGMSLTMLGKYLKRNEYQPTNPLSLGLLNLADRGRERVPLSSTLKYAGAVMQGIGLPPPQQPK